MSAERPTLDEIRTAIAKTVKDNCGIKLYTYPVVEDCGELPALVIEPRRADFEGSMGNTGHLWEFSLFVVVARTDEKSQYRILDRLISSSGPDSIVQILHDHYQLGLDGVNAHAVSMSGYGGSWTWYTAPHTGAILRIAVQLD